MRIAHDRQNIRAKFGAQMNIRADDSTQEFFQVIHHLIKIDNDWNDFLLPTEHQELAGQSGSLLSRSVNVHEQISQRICLIHLLQDEFAAAIDDGDQIVEVWGDAPG